MNFNQIRYFLTIVNCGSFSIAADEEYISQSCISKQIKSIEDELGVQLFTRNLHKLQLTSAGEDFYNFAKKVNLDFLNLTNNMRRYKGGPIHTLKIGSIPALSDYQVDTHLGRFQARNLSVKIDLEVREQKQLANMLKSNHLDMAIMRTSCLDTSGLECLKIVQDEIIVVCPEDHPLASKEEISMDMLSKEKFVLLDERSNVYHLCLKECEKYKFKPDIVITNSRHEAILSFVKEGLGITLLPRCLVSIHNSANLAFIDLASTIDSSVYLVCTKEKFKDPLIQQLWKYFELNCKI